MPGGLLMVEILLIAGKWAIVMNHDPVAAGSDRMIEACWSGREWVREIERAIGFDSQDDAKSYLDDNWERVKCVAA